MPSLGRTATTTGDWGETLRRMRQATDPWPVVSPSDVASNLPGGGLMAAWDESGKARDALKQGQLMQALSHYGNMALNMVPEGAGLMKLAAGGLAGIRAYHGSPHDFDQFSLDKIGTGEGAQAYGHGLYFAENEGVAKNYRDALGWQSQMKDPEGVAQYWIATHNGDKAKALAEVQQNAKNWQHVPDVARMYDEAAKLIPTLEPRPSPGRMYEVQINADPEHFLDWDKPLSEQPAVLDRLGYSSAKYPEDIIPDPSWTGAKFWAETSGSPKDRAQYLASGIGPKKLKDGSYAKPEGIPGIKYLDAGSRAAGDGSRNYVVFDDKLISILRKYGWVPGMAIPAAAMQEYQGQAPQT